MDTPAPEPVEPKPVDLLDDDDSIDAVLAKKKPAAEEYVVPYDPDEAADLLDAEERLEEAKAALRVSPDNAGRVEELEAAQEVYDAARKVVDANCVVFRLNAIGRQEWDDLIEAHQPTKDQRDKWRKANAQAASLGHSLRWNTDTFPPAAIASCVSSPRMSTNGAKKLWGSDRFSPAELEGLFWTIVRVNESRRAVKLGEGSSTIPS